MVKKGNAISVSFLIRRFFMSDNRYARQNKRKRIVAGVIAFIVIASMFVTFILSALV